MLPEFEYIIPSSLSEAVSFLRENGSETKIIGGGTDLVISLRRSEVRPRFILDISSLPELGQIEDVGDKIRVGAACTHTQISESPIIEKHARVLSEASAAVGSRQIRNLGTIGGNVVNGSPAADTVPALMVLNAQLGIVSEEGRRLLPLAEIYIGPYETNLKPYELVSHMAIDKMPKKAHHQFFRIARRKAMAMARINGAVLLQQRDGGGPIEEARISVGSVTPVPCRMSEAEGVLLERVPSEELIEQACSTASQTMVRMSGIRKSTEWKQPVVAALLRRAIKLTIAK